MASPVLSKNDTHKNLDDPRWNLVQRIVVSRSMGRSPLLSEFLLYICDRHLRNQSAELTEQRIGVHVFGRREGYNSNDDTTAAILYSYTVYRKENPFPPGTGCFKIATRPRLIHE